MIRYPKSLHSSTTGKKLGGKKENNEGERIWQTVLIPAAKGLGMNGQQGSAGRFGGQSWCIWIISPWASIRLLPTLTYRSQQAQVLTETRRVKTVGKTYPRLETEMLKWPLRALCHAAFSGAEALRQAWVKQHAVHSLDTPNKPKNQWKIGSPTPYVSIRLVSSSCSSKPNLVLASQTVVGQGGYKFIVTIPVTSILLDGG